MKTKLSEVSATLLTVVVLIGFPSVVFLGAPWNNIENERVIHLTAIMKNGIWTDQEVNGLNYWWKKFKPSTLILKKGEKNRLRLTSSDVTHSFYMPELFPDPIVVKAGYTEEISFIPQRSGEFSYYCTTVCGECHYYMRGSIQVQDQDRNIVISNEDPKLTCSHSSQQVEIALNNSESPVLKGEYLFNRYGCITCHGEGGKGGIYNPNYVNQYVPALNTIAERMKLYWPEDADTILTLLNNHVDLTELKNNHPIEGYSRFLAQFKSYRQKIKNGAQQLQKLDNNKPDPPLVMPTWKNKLSNEDINAILAYLISEYPWDDYE